MRERHKKKKGRACRAMCGNGGTGYNNDKQQQLSTRKKGDSRRHAHTYSNKKRGNKKKQNRY